MTSENISPQAALVELERRTSQYSDDEFYDIIVHLIHFFSSFPTLGCTFDTHTTHSTLGVSRWDGLLIFGFFVDIEFDTIFR